MTWLFCAVNMALACAGAALWCVPQLVMAGCPSSAVTLAPFFLAAMTAVALVGLLLLLTRARPSVAWGALGAVQVFLFLDAKVYLLLGVHLTSQVVVATLANASAQSELHFSAGTLGSLALGLVGMVALEATVWRACAAVVKRWPTAALHLQRAGVTTLAGVAAACILTLAVITPLSSPQADALWWVPLFQERASTAPMRPQYPLQPLPTVRAGRPLNVLYVLVESWRSDAFSADLTPNLWSLSAQHGCSTSSRHFSNAHTTEFATFSFLYGVNAYNFQPFQARALEPAPLRLLRSAGYSVRGFSGNALKEWNGAGFMLQALETYQEFSAENGQTADERMVRAVEGLGGDGRPAFTFLFFGSTHHNYTYPSSAQRFTPVLPEDYNHFAGDETLQADQHRIYNRYLNSVGYVDALLGRVLVHFAAELARGELLVVITGDHGEEFFEHGALGHAATRFIKERTQVPLILCVPGAPSQVLPLSSHVDLMPTVVDALHLEPAPNPAALFDGRSLASAYQPARDVVITGAHYPLYNDRLGLMTLRQKLWLRRDALHNTFALDRVTTLDDKPVKDPENLAAHVEGLQAASLHFLAR